MFHNLFKCVPGLLLYGCYGYRRSTEAIKPKKSMDEDFIMFEQPGMDTHVRQIQPEQELTKDILDES